MNVLPDWKNHRIAPDVARSAKQNRLQDDRDDEAREREPLASPRSKLDSVLFAARWCVGEKWLGGEHAPVQWWGCETRSCREISARAGVVLVELGAIWVVHLPVSGLQESWDER